MKIRTGHCVCPLPANRDHEWQQSARSEKANAVRRRRNRGEASAIRFSCALNRARRELLFLMIAIDALRTACFHSRLMSRVTLPDGRLP
jgi:hypothetical protein